MPHKFHLYFIILCLSLNNTYPLLQPSVLSTLFIPLLLLNSIYSLSFVCYGSLLSVLIFSFFLSFFLSFFPSFSLSFFVCLFLSVQILIKWSKHTLTPFYPPLLINQGSHKASTLCKFTLVQIATMLFDKPWDFHFLLYILSVFCKQKDR